MSQNIGPSAAKQWQSTLDCLCGFDAHGHQVFARHRDAASVAGLQPHLDTGTSIKSARWIPAAMKQEIMACNEAQSWSVIIEEKNEPGFHVFIHSLGIKGSAVCYLMEFDWIQRRANESEAVRFHLLQMARLACVGGLGGPIAHALNNPLATIRGFADVLKRRFSQVDKIGYFSDKIISNSERMRLTIEQLRNLSRARASSEANKPVQLNRVIQDTMHIMDEQFKMRNILFDSKLGSPLPCIAGDVTLWESLFLSLFALSRDSFQTQNDDRMKTISIETKATEQGVFVRYSDTSGRFPLLEEGSETNPMSLLGAHDSEFAVQVFVVLEVLKRHHATFKIHVDKNEATELCMTMESLADSPQLETEMAG